MLLLPVFSTAQQNTFSPYSRYGIGELSRTGFTNNHAMGGWSLGFADSLVMNLNDLSSLAGLKRTNFLMSLNSKWVTSQTENLSQKNSVASLGGIQIGVPLGPKGGLGFHLKPVSSVGYLINNNVDLDSLGTANYLYEGAGGLQEAGISVGYRLYKTLRVGAQVKYNFGSLQRSTSLEFDSTGFYHTKIQNRVEVKDLSFATGLSYTFKFPEARLRLSTGYEMGGSLSSKRYRVVYTYTMSGFTEIPKDTIDFENGTEGTITLPSEISFGFGYLSNNHWGIGADFAMSDWSNFENFGVSDNLSNSMSVSAGGYFTPDPNAAKSYWKVVTYRAGIHYDKTFLQLRDNQLTDLGISFGLSMPMNRSFSKMNLAFTAGQRGTTEAGLIKENYYQLSIGLSLNDKWFRKRRIE